MKPSPREYVNVNVNLSEMLVVFFKFYFFFLLPMIAIHQETVRPGALINSWIRKNIYGQGNLHDYLALDPLQFPYDDEVPDCDWPNMTPKQFYNDYVR